MKRPILSVAAMLAVSTLLSSAHAEGKTVLSPITVNAENMPQSATAPSLGDSQDVLRAIAREDYENSRAATMKDMLDYTPGVFAQSRTNEESRLSIRGSGLSRTFHLRGLSLYQDGIPVHYADGAADFQDVDPLAFSHVEVYKGANALQLGSATLGGAINFVTPTGYTADPLNLRLEAGSFGTRRAHLGSGMVMGDSDYYVSFSKQVSDGFRDHSRQNNARFYGNIGHKLSDRLETRLYVTYVDANQELPGAITKDQLKTDSQQANGFSQFMNYQRDYELWRVASKTTWQGNGYTVNGGLYTIRKDLDHPIFQVIDQRNEDYGAFADITFEGERNTVLFGTDLRVGDTDSQRFVNLTGAYGAMTANGHETSENATFYVEDRYKATADVTLIAGSQFLYTRRDFDDYFLANGDQSGEKDYHGMSPKIGALWDVTPEVQVFGNVSASYEPPTFSELTQSLPGVVSLADIDAQKAYTFEIGTRGSKGRYQWDIAAYRAWLRDELMMFSTGVATSGVQNADESVHQGIELGLAMDVTDALSSRMAYTWNDFHFDGDAQWGDNEIPGIPEHYLRAELRYDHHAGGWYIAPNIEAALDNYYVDMANTLEADAYVIGGITAGIDINEQASLFVDVRNLTDERYIATTNVVTTTAQGGTALFYPGDGRSVYAGLKYRF
jgi:iron complex outermembrane receptor protein